MKVPRVRNCIRSTRKDTGIKASTLAEAVNMNYRSLLHIELHEQSIDLDLLGAIADYLGVEVTTLIEPRPCPLG